MLHSPLASDEQIRVLVSPPHASLGLAEIALQSSHDSLGEGLSTSSSGESSAFKRATDVGVQARQRQPSEPEASRRSSGSRISQGNLLPSAHRHNYQARLELAGKSDSASTQSRSPGAMRLHPIRTETQRATVGDFSKKPHYPTLLGFRQVDNDNQLEKIGRASNKSKIARSFFGGTGEDTSIIMPHQQEASLNSLAAIEAVKDLELPSRLRIPGKKMTEQETAAWLERWVEDFDAERSLFTSGNNFTEIKLNEMLEVQSISAHRTGKIPSPGKPNAFRTAVCFSLLDRICPHLGTFAPIVNRLREEIAKSVYANLEQSDMNGCLDETSKALHYAFKAAPYFVDNVRLMETIQSMRAGYQDAQDRMQRAEAETKQLREDLVVLEARLDGYRMRIQTLGSELSHVQEERYKREALMMAEMQQMREKVVQAEFEAAQNCSASDNGVAISTNGNVGAVSMSGVGSLSPSDSTAVADPLVHVGSGINFNRVESETSNMAMKEALEFLLKVTTEILALTEQKVNQYTASVDLWRTLSMDVDDPSLLLRPGESLEHLPRMQVTDILLRFVHYHMKQSRRQFIIEGPVKPNNLDRDLNDGIMLIQVIQQCMPSEMQAGMEELLQYCHLEYPTVMRMQWIGQKMTEFTGDAKWMVIDLNESGSSARFELLMVLMLASPCLRGNVFGEAKLLQNLSTEITDRYDRVRDTFKNFSANVKRCIVSGDDLDCSSLELMMLELMECRKSMYVLSQKIPEVATEHRLARNSLQLTLSKVASCLQERSNHKISQSAHELGCQNVESLKATKGLDGNLRSTDQTMTIIKPLLESKCSSAAIPGNLNKVKQNLTKPAKHMLSNLSLEKVADLFVDISYEDQVRIQEKCAESVVVNYDLLRRTFRHYCKVHKSGNIALVQAGGAAMTITSWQLLMSDIQVLGTSKNCDEKRLKPEVLNQIFEISNFVINHKTGTYGPGPGIPELEVQEFVEALIRVAAALSKILKKDIVFTFQKILVSIEQHAKAEDSRAFREQCRGTDVEAVLNKYSTELMHVYKVYSGMDEEDADDLDSMNLMEFMTLTRDAGIQDVNLTKPEVVNIFIYVQDDGSVIREDDSPEAAAQNNIDKTEFISGHGMSDDTEMDYSEFCESLCGCACYKILDPYITMPQKLDFLIIKHILPLYSSLQVNQKKPKLMRTRSLLINDGSLQDQERKES